MAYDFMKESNGGRYFWGKEYVRTVSSVREYVVFVNLQAGIDSLARHLKLQNLKKGGTTGVVHAGFMRL